MAEKFFRAPLTWNDKITAKDISMAADYIAFEGVPDHAEVRIERQVSIESLVFKAKWEE